MNNYILSEIDSAQKKMSAYIALLNYRFMNLCVKADIAALLPVSVYVNGQEHNIEDTANVTMPTDFQLGVYPKDPGDLQDIIEGIYEAHPEFKMELQNTDDDASRYVLYTMPPVDSSRHDFLMNGVKGLYDECKARLETVRADYEKQFLEALGVAKPLEAKEASDALDELHHKCSDMIDELLDKKQDEIEAAFQRYQEEIAQKAETEFDYTKHMRLYEE